MSPWFLQVFFLQSEDQPNGLSDPADHSRLTENVARAFCVALCPHLKLLKEDGMAKLGLRVTLDSDQVGSDVTATLWACLFRLLRKLGPANMSGGCFCVTEAVFVLKQIVY